MKKLILFIGFSFLVLTIWAQRPNLQLGITFGINARVFNIKPLVLVIDANGQIDTIGQSRLTGFDAGYQIGFFFRATQKRRYAEIGTNFLRSSVPILDISQTDTSNVDETTVYGVEFPILVGYRIVDKALFKLRVNTGFSLTVIGKVRDNVQGYSRRDFVNPRVGLRYGLGFDLAFFAFDMYYTLGLTREFRELETRSQSHGLLMTISVIF